MLLFWWKLMNELFPENFHETPQQLPQGSEFSRLVYATKHLNIVLPTWIKIKLPFFLEIEKPLSLLSPLLQNAYRDGSVYGEATLDEYKILLDKLCYANLESYEERQKFFSYINTLSDGLFEENHVESIPNITEGEAIYKFDSGFFPFDQVVGGFYQGIVTVAGNPGSGKTSLLLSLAKELAQSYPIWYFQTEIPLQPIKARLALLEPETWHKESKLFSGNYNIDAILDLVKKSPDETRIIIYDSPEINLSSLPEIEYFKATYQKLVSLKMLSKCVFVTSQVKQNVGWDDLGVTSLSDSASKGRYTDILIYVARFGDTIVVKSSKNRFGEIGQCTAKYDFAKLKLMQQNDSWFYDKE